jgi:Ig-like domain from next to BRCA1 gene
MFRVKKLIWLLPALLIIFSSACGGQPTTSSDVFYTQAAETMVVARTQTSMAVTNTPTEMPTLGETLTPKPTNTPLITSTFTPGAATNTPITLNTPRPTQSGVCDNAEFVDDVTIPDGTEVLAGSNFVKTWRFKNLGPCTWTADYRLVFSYVSDTGKDGIFTPPAPANFPETVVPGDEVDISITLTAPTKADSYTVWFRLQNAKGYNFGPEFWASFRVP